MIYNTNVDYAEFENTYTKIYDFLYKNEELLGIESYSKPIEEFSRFMKDPIGAKFYSEITAYMQDIVFSDREIAAFMCTFSQFN